MKKVVFCLAMAGVLCLGTPLRASLVSTFDSGSEGWTGSDSTGDWTAQWISSGGNPGGYMRGSETISLGGTGYFIAPASWGGNLTQYIGGTLSFDEKVFQGSDPLVDYDVKIYSGPSDLVWTSGTSLITSDWVTHQVQLTSANFHGNLSAVLSNVTAIWIRGELITGPEQEGLDNVRLESVVPEACTLVIWSLLGAGSWLGMRVWRRRGPVGATDDISSPATLVARPSWTPEARQAIHEIIARGRH
jgi:hypothetical protein